MRHQLLCFVAVIALVAAVPAMAAEIEVSSQIDAVTVYPDGATVTRLIRLAYGPFQLGHLARGAIEEVTGKVLQEQLGAGGQRASARGRNARKTVPA